MSDTPDVLDAIDMVLEAWIDIENVQRVRDGLLRVFTEQQLVVVKAPGLSHGDELVRVDGLRVTGTQDAPTFNQEPVWRRLRRSVRERRCSTCDGRKVVEGHAWRRIDETTGFPARELVPCPACSVPENGDTQ